MAKGVPSHRRKRLGEMLRTYRLAIDPPVTQAQSAAVAGVSQSEINRMEKADKGRILMGALDKLIEFYKVPDDDAALMRAFARSPYSGVGTFVEPIMNREGWQRYGELERQARVINAVHLQTHPGLLQCQQYMRRQFELANVADIEAKVKARLDRQRAILDQDRPPEYTVIIDEACLHTSMGVHPVLAAQVRHLLALTERPHLTILIKPFDAIFPALTYGWTSLGFSSLAVRDFVAVEYEIGAVTIDDEDDLVWFQTRWELVRAASLSEVDSRALLARASAKLNNE